MKPLDDFNLKIYCALQIGGREGLRRFIEKEMGDNDEENKIVISRWNTGVHYYAKVDGVDVIGEGGEVKWNTYEEAYRQAVRLIKS